MSNNYEPQELTYSLNVCEADLIILAAGFEDRAIHFISEAKFKESAFCILVGFNNGVPLNNDIWNRYLDIVSNKFQPARIIHVKIKEKYPQRYEKDIEKSLAILPREINNIWIDISGFPTYGICSTLVACRSFYSNLKQTIIYTEAKEYHPSHEEFLDLQEKHPDGIEFLPKSMALEMSEVLILESFSGHRSKEGVSCLAIFCGYEVHRSAGVIDSINPSKLLMLYGNPGNSELAWRLNLSQELHKKFEVNRMSAIEVVSTLSPYESLNRLEEYYQYLFEDYDFTIAPVCSKMQVVGTYLFWEKHKEVQLVFPLPIGYSIDLQPKGVRRTFKFELEPKSSLYQNLNINLNA